MSAAEGRPASHGKRSGHAEGAAAQCITLWTELILRFSPKVICALLKTYDRKEDLVLIVRRV